MKSEERIKELRKRCDERDIVACIILEEIDDEGCLEFYWRDKRTFPTKEINYRSPTCQYFPSSSLEHSRSKIDLSRFDLEV